MLFNYINIIIIDNKMKYRVEILLERKNVKYKKRYNHNKHLFHCVNRS